MYFHLFPKFLAKYLAIPCCKEFLAKQGGETRRLPPAGSNVLIRQALNDERLMNGSLLPVNDVCPGVWVPIQGW